MKPELCAVAPNQVWSWDITDLKGPVRGKRFKLYVCLDLFSRLVVGWTLAEREDADLGSAMTSHPVSFLLTDLGITRSHSRPHVSDDNPYSGAQFKTLKYHPTFPERFGSIEDARSFCRRFFHW